MMFLAIAALVAAAVGAGISAYGAVKEGEQRAEAAELEAQRLRESRAVLAKQKAAQIAGKEAIASTTTIRQRELSFQALETSRAGRAARGASAAGFGVGSLGGASPLRQSMEIQRRTQEALGIVAGQKELVGIQAGVQTLAAEAQISGTEFDIRWAGLMAEQKEKEAEWAEQYGWLSAAGTLLGGAGQVAGLFPLPKKVK